MGGSALKGHSSTQTSPKKFKFGRNVEILVFYVCMCIFFLKYAENCKKIEINLSFQTPSTKITGIWLIFDLQWPNFWTLWTKSVSFSMTCQLCTAWPLASKMAARFKGKMPVAILGRRGHQVQNHLNGLKGHDLSNNVQKLGHCTQKIGEMTAFSIQQVKHHFRWFCNFWTVFCVLASSTENAGISSIFGARQPYFWTIVPKSSPLTSDGPLCT